MSDVEGKPLRAGWNKPVPESIPRSTYWPASLAMGITFFGWGFVTSHVVLAVGFIQVVVSLAGWIGEIRHER